MKRSLSGIILVVLAVAIFQLACTRQETNTNMAGPSASPTVQPKPVDTAMVETEIRAMENDWTRILKERDVEAMRRAFADDVILIYPDGSLGNKEQELKDLQSGALTFDSWDFVDMSVKVLDNDAAVVTGHTSLKNGKYKAPNGTVSNISGEYRFLDVFARRDGRWQVVASQATLIRNPAPSASPAASPMGTMKKEQPRPSATPMGMATP